MIGPLKTHPTSLMTTINHFLSEPTAPQISPEIPFIDRLRSIAQQAHACETCGETYTPFSLAKLVPLTLTRTEIVDRSPNVALLLSELRFLHLHDMS